MKTFRVVLTVLAAATLSASTDRATAAVHLPLLEGFSISPLLSPQATQTEYVTNCTVDTPDPEYSRTIQLTCCPPPGMSGNCDDFFVNHRFEPAPEPSQPPVQTICTANYSFTDNGDGSYTLTYYGMEC